MVHRVNYVQMIAIIYPKNLFQLLRIPWSFILEWKIWIALEVTKDYSRNITVGISRGKICIVENWSIKPGKVVNFGHQANVSMHSWGISTESFDQTI